MFKKVGTGWAFENEIILEDFVWNNLQSFFGLIPIAKQYKTLNNQICDILAINENHQLIILELKNTEDRYIVQQLTRYQGYFILSCHILCIHKKRLFQVS
jgi:hypothetical protein